MAAPGAPVEATSAHVFRLAADAPDPGRRRFTRHAAPSTARAASASAETLLDVPLLAHLARGQIAQPHAVPQRRVLGDDAADADLDVVGMRTEWRARPRGVNGV